MSPNDAIVLQTWHILVAVLLPLVGFLALLWRTWIKPANDQRVTITKWRVDVDRDITDLRDRLTRHEQGDAAVVRKLDQLAAKLTEIKVELGRIDERIKAMGH